MKLLKMFVPELVKDNPNARLGRKDFFTKISDTAQWKRLKDAAGKVGLTPTEFMQAVSPFADEGNNENIALDYLHSKGIYFEDKPELGIVATELEDLGEYDEVTVDIVNSYLIDRQKVGMRSFEDKQKALADLANDMHRVRVDDNLSSSERGTILRQWQDFVNFEQHLAYPNFEAIFGRVIDSRGDSPRVVESHQYENAELIRRREEGARVYVSDLRSDSTPVPMIDNVTGVTWTRKEQAASSFTLQLLRDHQEQAAVALAEDQMERGVQHMAANGARDTKTPITADEDGLLKAIMLAPKKFVWTTVLGQEEAIQTWLKINRSNFYGGPRELAGATAVGSDFYARAPLPRYVAEVPGDWGLGVKDLLLVDARFAIDLYNWFAFDFTGTDFSLQSDRYMQIRTLATGVAERYPSRAAGSKPYEVVTLP